MNQFRILLVLALFTIGNLPLGAQEGGIGTVPIYHMTSPQIIFVDADAGELKSFAVLPENIMSVAINEEKGVFYAQTRHYVYKVDLESGDLLDEYQYMEVLEKTEKDMIDPNMNIYPSGVTNEGLAIYIYNKEQMAFNNRQQELLSSMEGASLDEINAISAKLNKMNEMMQDITNQQEFFLVDMENKSQKPFGKYDLRENRMLQVKPTGEFLVHDKVNQVIKYIDLASNEVVKEVSSSGLYDQYPELKNLKSSSVTMISDDLLQFSFFRQNGQMGGLYILFDIKKNEAVLYKEYGSPMSAIYPLFYVNTTNYIFGDKSCEVGPMPAIPDFGQPSGYSKKKIAAWQEEMKKKQMEHQKALNEWQERATNPDYCTIKIWESDALENVRMEIPKAAYASVYNDKYALVNRNYELAMYNLETKELVWTIDTEF